METPNWPSRNMEKAASSRLVSGPATAMITEARRVSILTLRGFHCTGLAQPNPASRISSAPIGSRWRRGLSVSRPAGAVCCRPAQRQRRHAPAHAAAAPAAEWPPSQQGSWVQQRTGREQSIDQQQPDPADEHLLTCGQRAPAAHHCIQHHVLLQRRPPVAWIIAQRAHRDEDYTIAANLLEDSEGW